MPPSVDVWFVAVSNDTDGMGPFPAFWMYSAVNLRKKLYVTSEAQSFPKGSLTAPKKAVNQKWLTATKRNYEIVTNAGRLSERRKQKTSRIRQPLFNLYTHRPIFFRIKVGPFLPYLNAHRIIALFRIDYLGMFVT